MTYTAYVWGYHTLEFEGALRWYDLPFSPRRQDGTFADLLATGPDLEPLLYTGISGGPVTVLLELSDIEPTAEPSLPEDGSVAGRRGEADVVVETSVLARGGDFGLYGWEDDYDHSIQVPAGWLRMRIYAYGRRIAYDEAVSTPVEHLTVQLWPQLPSSTVNITTGERIEPHSYVPEPEQEEIWIIERGPDRDVARRPTPEELERIMREREQKRQREENLRRIIRLSEEGNTEDP